MPLCPNLCFAKQVTYLPVFLKEFVKIVRQKYIMLDPTVEERHTQHSHVKTVAKLKTYLQYEERTQHTYTPHMCMYTWLATQIISRYS